MSNEPLGQWQEVQTLLRINARETIMRTTPASCMGLCGLVLLLLAAGVAPPAAISAGATTPVAATDPLPSWNPGPAKNTILQFVTDVTDPAAPSYVPPAERIAVFDNDGTLWTEKPIIPQVAFLFQRIVELAPEHPEWQTTQPYQAVLEQDLETLQSLSEQQVEELIFATHAGMSAEAFAAEAKAFLDTARHPRFGVLYTETVYQPMLELLAFLRAHDFKTFVVSGGGIEFIRVYSEEVYAIPRDDIVGSSLQYEFQLTADGSALIRQPEMDSVNVNEMKPINIQRHIGRRPILAAGNGDVDLEMLQYTGGDEGPYLNLVIVHDDAKREYDYTTGAEELMAAAAQSPWMLVSMKRDFKTIFPGATQSANPASVNCVEQGGTLSIEERGDGGQYGVCAFEDKRQCEEWALLRGDCPVGGVKVTGYATPAARYCAITGGAYTITGNSGADDEQGTCTLKDGARCDAWDYYNGTCDASTATLLLH
jgi:putative hemolysin